jgi:predicted DNA-binding transcriptional regulator AlpA
MTTRTRLRSPVTIPTDFPHPQRLGGRDLFLSVLGDPAISTFHRWMADGKIPAPKKLGQLNRWLEADMAKVRDAGVS